MFKMIDIVLFLNLTVTCNFIYDKVNFSFNYWFHTWNYSYPRGCSRLEFKIINFTNTPKKFRRHKFKPSFYINLIISIKFTKYGKKIN